MAEESTVDSKDCEKPTVESVLPTKDPNPTIKKDLSTLDVFSLTKVRGRPAKTSLSFDAIVISGGGIKCIGILGALHCFVTNGLLDMKTVTSYSGASAGSMIIFMLSIGYSPLELFIALYQSKLLEKLHASLNLMGPMHGFGLYKFGIIQAEMESMCINKTGILMNLGEVKKVYGKDLSIVTFNNTTKEPEIFSPKTQPSMPCITAIRCSANIPFVFDRFKYQGSWYLDGGLAQNFPIKEVDDGCNRVLGIVCDAGSPSGNDDNVSDTIGIINYAFNLISIPINTTTKKNIREASSNCTIVTIGGPNRKPFDFSLTQQGLIDLFSLGYACAEKHAWDTGLLVPII